MECPIGHYRGVSSRRRPVFRAARRVLERSRDPPRRAPCATSGSSSTPSRRTADRSAARGAAPLVGARAGSARAAQRDREGALALDAHATRARATSATRPRWSKASREKRERPMRKQRAARLPHDPRMMMDDTGSCRVPRERSALGVKRERSPARRSIGRGGGRLAVWPSLLCQKPKSFVRKPP